MPIYVGDGKLIGDGSSLAINNVIDTTVFKQGLSTYGGNLFAYAEASYNPGFIAGSSTDPGWVNFATDGWAKCNNYCDTTVYNRGSLYVTGSKYFLVPITGPYLFVWSTYGYSSSYIHPQFAVNGNVSTRRYTTPYRIRGHGFVANYQFDCQTEEVIDCVAGDQIEVYMYAGGTGYHYPRHSLFAGVYVG